MADDDKTHEERAAEEAAAAKAAEEEAARKAEEDEAFDKDRAMHTIRTLRAELKDAKAGSKKATELEARLKEIEDKDLDEKARAEKRAAEAEAKVEAAEKKLRHANLLAELAKPEHGLVNAKAAAKLIENVEYDDSGEPTNLADILPGFLEENSFLKATSGGKKPPVVNIDGGAGNTAGKGPDLTAEEQEAAKALGLTLDEYKKFKGKTSVQEIVAAIKKPEDN